MSFGLGDDCAFCHIIVVKTIPRLQQTSVCTHVPARLSCFYFYEILHVVLRFHPAYFYCRFGRRNEAGALRNTLHTALKDFDQQCNSIGVGQTFSIVIEKV